MDNRTIEIVKTLHEDAVNSGLSKASWKAEMKRLVKPAELQELVGNAKSGLLYLRDQSIVDLAVREYPWMNNRITVERKQFRSEKMEKVTMPSWIDRIRDQGIVRPKDLIHLNRICELAENKDALEDMDF